VFISFAQSVWIVFLTASFSVQLSVIVGLVWALALLIQRVLGWMKRTSHVQPLSDGASPISTVVATSTLPDVGGSVIVTEPTVKFEQAQTSVLPLAVSDMVSRQPMSPISVPKGEAKIRDEYHVSRAPITAPRSVNLGPRQIQKAKIFDPNHFRRHSKVPGFLYLARNPFHEVGLHKLGYTTESPITRLTRLNEQHCIASDIGTFELIHSVPVSDSYEAEQALFEVLSDARVVAKREFFFESQEFLTRGLDAAREFSAVSTTAFTQFYEWSLDRDDWKKLRPAQVNQVSVTPLLRPEDGWVYIARNPWHRANIYRVSCSKFNPLSKVEELNATQRKLTSQIGFYALVYCIGSVDIGSLWTGLNRRLTKYRLKGSRVFFEAQLTELQKLIHETVCEPQAVIFPDTTHRISTGQIIVEQVHGRPLREWVAWTAPCPGCGAILRLKGTIGALEYLSCPSCELVLNCHVGSRGATISVEYLNDASRKA
jgi:hypothetical protein